MEEERAKLAWCMFYSAIMGWQFHPGTRSRLTTEEGAKVADGMLHQYQLRERDQWAGWQQHR